MMRLSVFCCIMIISLSLSCSTLGFSKYRSYPDNPYTHIKTIAIIPFYNQTQQKFDTIEMTNIFASELIKSKGFDVIRPLRIMDHAKEQETDFNDIKSLIALGKSLRADSILVASVTDYDPYSPPRLALSVQLFHVESDQKTSLDIDRIIQSATWKPFKIDRKTASNLVSSFEKMYDSHSDRIRAEINEYARAQEDDNGFLEGEEFLSISRRYWQFVSCLAIRHLIDLAKNHSEPTQKP